MQLCAFACKDAQCKSMQPPSKLQMICQPYPEHSCVAADWMKDGQCCKGKQHESLTGANMRSKTEGSKGAGPTLLTSSSRGTSAGCMGSLVHTPKRSQKPSCNSKMDLCIAEEPDEEARGISVKRLALQKLLADPSHSTALGIQLGMARYQQCMCFACL